MVNVDPGKCLHCGQCVGTCPHMALTLNDMHIETEESRCEKCAWCVRSCPVGAIILGGEN